MFNHVSRKGKWKGWKARDTNCGKKKRVDSPKNKMMLFGITSLSTIDGDHDMLDSNDGHPFHQFGGHGVIYTKDVWHEKKNMIHLTRGELRAKCDKCVFRQIVCYLVWTVGMVIDTNTKNRWYTFPFVRSSRSLFDLEWIPSLDRRETGISATLQGFS